MWKVLCVTIIGHVNEDKGETAKVMSNNEGGGSARMTHHILYCPTFIGNNKYF